MSKQCLRYRSLAFLVSGTLAGLSSAQGHVRTVDEGRQDVGSSWLLELETSGAPHSQLQFGDVTPGFTGDLAVSDLFGSALAPVGDLNGDGTIDFAVGAPGDDHGGPSRGAVWILLRDADGDLIGQHAIRSGEAAMAALTDNERIGSALACLGDLDGDGRPELAVGGNPGAGALGTVRILSLAADGSVHHEQRISESLAGFGGDLDLGDRFGSSLGTLGDFDGDGVADLAVGASGDDDGGSNSGALWLLFLDTDASVLSELKISRTSGGFGGGLTNGDNLGSAVCRIGDLDSDGVDDLAVGASAGVGGVGANGALFVLFLNANGTVRAQQLVTYSPNQAGFGSAAVPLGDLDGDGVLDLAVGAATATGTVFVLFLNADGTVRAQHGIQGEISSLTSGDRLGTSLAALGDLDGDGYDDFLVGAPAHEGLDQADYTNLQAAVDGADEGDTILVRAGDHLDPAVIDAKSLTIQGDGVVELLNVRVQNLGPSQTVALSGLRFQTYNGSGALELADDQGLVWLDECRALLPDGGFGVFQGPALRIQNCAQVVLNRCLFKGASAGQSYISPAPAGLDLSNSTVHAYACTFTGANGQGIYDEPFTHSEQGGDGIRMQGSASFLFLSGCEADGGAGIAYGPFPFATSSCSAGGNGLTAAGTTVALNSIFNAGAGGSSGSCGPGLPYTGSVELQSGSSLSFSTNQLAHEGEDIVYTFQGPPHVPIYLTGSPNPNATYVRSRHGTLMTGSPHPTQLMGMTDAGGILQVVNPLGLLPPSSDVRTLYLQAWMIEIGPPQGKVRDVRYVTLGAGKVFLVLDQSF